MLTLIDYGSGNIRSVHKALEKVGGNVRRASSPEELAGATAIVLPGVGAFGDCVEGIRSRGLWEPISQWLADGKPFLGICVGYQLLFEGSEEADASSPGFGFFAGQVKRFQTPGLKVPQIGWNALSLSPHPLWEGLPEHPHLFFVHSYYPVPVDSSVITSRATYGETFAASAARGAVAGVQFHPEKSQDVGLTILRNFVNACPAA